MTDPLPRLVAALSDRYRIERELGQGGMATVYLAQDLKHDRKVAIKVLKPDLAAVIGAERFVTEIKTTAALQHPHILPLFDSGEADSYLYYVMPFIDGETLRDKLDRETQLGIEEAVGIASDVADALDYAHRQGVIHRDIKPENILLANGRPMVADFGIALALSAAAGGRKTETGMSLGTPHYMSPEQATAEKDITARSDIYSLGSVLYEMLTGNPPHTGASAQQIIMKIVTEDAAPVTAARKSVPPNVSAAVAKSLENLAADRFDSAKAFADALTNPSFRTTSSLRGIGVPGGAPSSPWPVRILASATGVLALGLAWALLGRPAAPPAVPFHATLSDTLLQVLQGIAISPDGRLIALAGNAGDGHTQLLLRAADDEAFVPVAGTVDAMRPRFSPDGRYIAFLQADARQGVFSYRRVPTAGGEVQPIADSVEQGAWGADGSIIVVRGGAVLRVTTPGAVPELVTRIDSIIINAPELLPDGSGMLFSDDELRGGRALLLDFKTGAVTTLVERARYPRYVPGYIIYHTSPPSVAVLAAPFDLKQKRLTGPPVPILADIWQVAGLAQWDVSENGTMVYVHRPELAGGERLAWVDMQGSTTVLPVQVNDFETPRVSPDGRRIAFSDFDGQVTDVFDISTGATAILPGYFTGAWAPDSRSLFLSAVQASRAITRIQANGTGGIDTIYRGDGQVFAVSPDESMLVLGRSTPTRGADIDILRLDGDQPEIIPYLRANWNERQPALSPDGDWVAYISDETGRNEVYVRSFPEPGAPLRISDNGGVGPAWGQNASTLFYAGPDSMTRVRLTYPAAGPQLQSRTRLFSHGGFEVTTAAFFQSLGYGRRYDVDPTGDRLLMVRSPEESFTLGVPARVITNWFDELRRRVAEAEQP